MTSPARPLTEIAAQWREARKLYTVYSALLEQFALGLPPSRDLESPIDRAEPEAIKRMQDWFAQMDERVHVHQLRQLLQTSLLGTEDNLRALITRHLGKAEKADTDRDKVDFLLVQYLSSCAPAGFYDRAVSFEEIAKVLEPVLGEAGHQAPDWAAPMEKAAANLDSFRSLRELLAEGTLDAMRKLKAGAGEMYFAPNALVAITRFNFLVRSAFVRLISADLHAVRFSLHELEQKSVTHVNCAAAGLGKQESIERLRQICQEWKKPFRAAYAAGQNFKQLIAIRNAVEEALAHAPGEGQPAAGADVVETFSTAQTTAEAEISSPAAPPSPQKTFEPAAATAAPPISLMDISEPLGTMTPKAIKAPDFFEKSEASTAVTEFSGPHFSPAASTWTPPTPIHAPEETAEVKAPRKPTAQEWGTVAEDRDASQKHSKKTAGPAAQSPEPEAEEAAAPPKATEPERKDVLIDLPQATELISLQLSSAGTKAGSVAHIVLGEAKLMLSSWEVAAFLKPGDETAQALQRAVAARAILGEQMDRRKKGGASLQLSAAIQMSRQESTKVQTRIGAAKQAKDVDSAVNLAATNKRLLSVIDEAQKVLLAPK